MPLVKLLHVCSSSSEDPNHPASNLLNPDTYRKWACATAGEKQAVVVLQLEKSTNIHAVDIGNNGSAFVEVLVGRSTSPDEYQVLLVSSTFMSPADSKSWTNTNRVRMFGKDKLCKGVSEQNWDRVKVVCTQPYIKTEKYGLTFVKLHAQPEAGEVLSEEGKIGAFKLREEVKDLPPGSFFKKEQQQKEEKQAKPVVTAAAQARKASAAALKDDSAGSSAVAKVSANVTSPATKGVVSSSPAKTCSEHNTKPSDTAPVKKPAQDKAPPAKKPRVDESAKPKDIPFADIMRGVVFVLSGFKNPYRTELRDKAIAMGARYEGDWGPGCTHLVCAFSNTPKFSQVKAQKGLIVKKEWILECHRAKQRLPAKQFRLSGESGDSGAEDERYDKEEGAIYRKEKQDQEAAISGKDQEAAISGKDQEAAISGKNQEATISGKDQECAAAVGSRFVDDRQRWKNEAIVHSPDETPTVSCDKEEEEDPYGGSTDEEMEEAVMPKRAKSLDDDNTDEEIERIKQQAEAPGTHTNEDPGDGKRQGRDSMQPVGKDKEKDLNWKRVNTPRAIHRAVFIGRAGLLRDLTNLPDFYSKYHFLLYGSFSQSDRRLLTRYITAYNGSVNDYMDGEVTHVVTQEPWDDKFDQALSENNSLVFVKPKWIFACHQKQSCVPCQPYLVVAT